jgi:hypothetical protein
MFRLPVLVVTAVLMAVLGAACGPAVKCGDLCVPGEANACGGLYTCVSPGKCEVVMDAGPNSCP